MFDWEPGVTLHGESFLISHRGEVSWFFSSCGVILGYILELQRGWPFKTRVFSGWLNRASQGPFHLEQKTQGPSHIHIPQGKHLLRFLWKVGLPLQSKSGNLLSSPDDMVCTELSSSFFNGIDFPLDLRWVSQGISGFS